MVVAVVAAACGASTEVEERTAVERGGELFRGKGAGSGVGLYACVTCHDEREKTAFKPGATLAGVVGRPSYWGGAETDLLRAINACRFYFMQAPAAWARTDADARSMFAWLASLDGPGDQVAFTVPQGVSDVPNGDATRGATVYQGACQPCHGTANDGGGKLLGAVPVLPGEAYGALLRYGFDPYNIRLSFIEKTRHGAFVGLTGVMPPFSVETISEEDVGHLLAFLRL